MIRGLYGAASALDVASQAQDTIAQNLAHATVPGYRAHGVTFETFSHGHNSRAPSSSAMGAQASKIYSDFRPGAMQYTGQPLDVALEGDGFFVVKGPDGPLYSRDGVLRRSANGQLQNASGLPLEGEGGPITIPADASSLVIDKDGTVRANKAAVGRIKVARFADPDKLTPAGTTLFKAPAGVSPEESKDKVVQGYRELSNVQPAFELVAMIRNSRYFEAAQRAMRRPDGVGAAEHKAAVIRFTEPWLVGWVEPSRPYAYQANDFEPEGLVRSAQAEGLGSQGKKRSSLKGSFVRSASGEQPLQGRGRFAPSSQACGLGC